MVSSKPGMCVASLGDRLATGRGLVLPENQGHRSRVIDAKRKRFSAHIGDPKQNVSQADVYQTMAYAQLNLTDRLTLLYPFHAGLCAGNTIHAHHRNTDHDTILETASINMANGDRILDRIWKLLIEGDFRSIGADRKMHRLQRAERDC